MLTSGPRLQIVTIMMMIVIIFIIILTLGNSACVLLEGEPEDGDLLVRDRVEKALNDPLGESQPLEVVEGDDLGPVFGHLWQVQALADVDQIEDVLLEARPAKADTGL